MNTTHPTPATLADLLAAPRAWLQSLARRTATLRSGSRPSAAPTGQLAKGATTWILAPLGRQITCDAGTLWLTFDGEPQDVILEAGESHRCASRSALSIHALCAAALRID